MNIKIAPWAFAIPLLVTLGARAQSVSAQTNAVPGAVTVPVSDKNLLYVGRWDRSNVTTYHGNWIGAYVRTNFTGTTVSANLGGHSGLDVSIDGEPTRVITGGPGLVALHPIPLKPGLHTLLVGVKGGGGWDFRGLALDPGAITKLPPSRPLIEFVGDSITCGSLGPLEAAGNYTWLTAEALGCDHTQIAWPGRALTTGYGCQDDKAGLDTQYFQQNCFYDSPKAPWDFATYTPKLIVINLGQNDGCGGELDATFTASYINFVKQIRAKFPTSQIVALRMFGGGHFGEDTRQAVAAVQANGDARVHCIDTQGWLNPTDFADGVHPNDAGNVKVARYLAPLLRPLLTGKANPAQSVSTVGEPAHPDSLGQALQNAYIRGERHIVITPGTYLLSRKGQSQITLDHWQNASISAYKVTLILNNEADVGRLFFLDHCINVTIAGPLLTQTSQTAYQGRVLVIGKDNDGKPNFDWRPAAGYPVPPGALKDFWINFVDAKTRTINLEAGDYYHTTLEPLGNGVYRIHLNENRPVRFEVGDWMVSRYGNPPNKVGLTGCRNCTIKDVTLLRNGFAPIFDGESGGNHYLGCHWALGPRPSGATEDPVVTNAADGLHCPDDSVGPDIENCTFDGVFLDDCIAIHGGYHKVISANNPVIVAQNAYAFYKVGEPVRISNDKGFYLQANVTALKDNGDGNSTLTLDTTAVIPTDASLSNPVGGDGAGYKIIGCRLGNTRSRGIIVKSDNGIIRDNVISHCGLAIRTGPEWASEADYSQNVVVADNTLVQNGDGIVIDGSGVKQNRNVTIRRNRFLSNNGNDVYVAWADGVTITGNTFAAPVTRAFGGKPRPPITVRDASNVTISGNQVQASAAYEQPFVQVGSNVKQLTQDGAAK